MTKREQHRWCKKVEKSGGNYDDCMKGYEEGILMGTSDPMGDIAAGMVAGPPPGGGLGNWFWEDRKTRWCRKVGKTENGSFDDCMADSATLQKLKNVVSSLPPSPTKNEINVAISQLKIRKNQLQNQLGEIQKGRLGNIKPEFSQVYSKYTPYSNRESATPSNIPQLSGRPDIKLFGLVSPSATNNAFIELQPTVPPELYKDPSLWKSTVDKYGRVTLTATFEGQVYILDYNTPPDKGGEMYRYISESKGYVFGPVRINFQTGTLSPVKTNGMAKTGFKNSPVYSISTAAVLPTMIKCDNINDVTLVLGSNADSGFMLPEDLACNCSVNFSFDYMLKYDATNLINCADNCKGCECETHVYKDEDGDGINDYEQEGWGYGQGQSMSTIPCTPAIFNNLTLENIFCKDFITFTSTEEESQLLLNNFNNNTVNPDEEWKVWQSDVVQTEPSEECCRVMGGEVIPYSEWVNINVQSIWSPTSIKYNEIKMGDFDVATTDANIVSYINSQESDITQPLTSIRSQYCVDSKTWDQFIQPCEIKYTNYFTTHNICSIFPPENCALWSWLLFKSQLDNDVAIYLEKQLELCVEEYYHLIDLIGETDVIIVDIETELSNAQNEGEEEDEETEDEIEDIDGDIVIIVDEIDDIIDVNNDIDEAINATDPDSTNCDVYSVAISDANDDLENSLTYCTNLSQRGDNAQIKKCVENRQEEINEKILTYNSLLGNCHDIQRLQNQLIDARVNNNTKEIASLQTNISEKRSTIDNLLESCGGITNPNILVTPSQKEGMAVLINKISQLLNINTPEGRASITTPTGYITLSVNQQTTLNVIQFQNKTKLGGLSNELENKKTLSRIGGSAKRRIHQETDSKVKKLLEDLEYYKRIKTEYQIELKEKSCCVTLLPLINEVVEKSNNILIEIQNEGRKCYDTWYKEMYNNYESYQTDSNCGDYLSYIDDLKLNLKIFVDTGADPNNPTIAPLESVPYTNLINPIWEWDPCNPCEGITISGDSEDVINVMTGIYNSLTESNTLPCPEVPQIEFPLLIGVGNTTIIWPGPDPLTDFSHLPVTPGLISIQGSGMAAAYKGPTIGWIGSLTTLHPGETYIFVSNDSFSWTGPNSSDTLPYDNPTNELFKPCWKTLNFSLPECVCNDLRVTYPGKKFYMGIEIENYECAVCVLVDNIEINVTDCSIQREAMSDNCLIPQLSCVIDNKKSWVYTEAGIKEETIYPYGICNSGSTENYTVNKMVTPENRLWQELEYRYTEYDVNHSDLIINTKSTAFAIDPANAIECDVYNFWKNIDCDECPTSCSSGDSVTFDGEVYYTGGTLTGYTIELSGTTPAGLIFSCETYTNILQNQVLELKNDYYNLTADYNKSLSATYSELLSLGEDLSLFEIEKNNCGSDNIIIGNNKELDNLYGIIVEDFDGTISFWESYLFSGTTPYMGGNLIEVLSGVTAQTFNQTSGLDEECCKSLNHLITNKGIEGLGVDKNYVWNNSISACTWTEVNDCEGDCEYSGVINVNSRGVDHTYVSDNLWVWFVQTSPTTIDVMYKSSMPIGIFQLDFISGTPIINSASGGDAAIFTTLLGATFGHNVIFAEIGSQPFIPAGSGLLTQITFASDITTIYTANQGKILNSARFCNTTISHGGTGAGADINCDTTLNVLDAVFMWTPIYSTTGLEGASANAGCAPFTQGNMSGADGIENLYGLIFMIFANFATPGTYGPFDDSFVGFEDLTLSSTRPCEIEEKPVCINPLDYLSADPADINVKDVFDEIVLSSLIDVKSRQTISGYPMLQLFYQLYLNANNCGKSLSGKLTYNSLFDFMDKIGDYWLDLIEQVVPATTIWEGCESSGKLYRNTIFDQNKYAYRKYALNYVNSHECEVSGITSSSIGKADVDIRIKTISLLPTNPNIEGIKEQIRELEGKIYSDTQLIDKLNIKVCALRSQDTSLPASSYAHLLRDTLPPGLNQQTLLEDNSITVGDLIAAYDSYIATLTDVLNATQSELTKTKKLLSEEQAAAVTQEATFQQTFTGCDSVANKIHQAQTDLKNNYTVGTSSYYRQIKYLTGLKQEYKECIRKANTQVSDFDTVFITQIYDSNEYEGNIMVTGNDDWNMSAEGIPGPFFNTELIHNCDNG